MVSHQLHLLLLFVPSVLSDLVCYRQWYFDKPQPAPRRCPSGDWLFYYECCGQLDDCCQRWRIELIVVAIVVVLLLIFCCCCCLLGMVFRQKSEKKEPDGLSKDERECHERRTTQV